ncbi:hypothetical protein [Nannocystis sp. SCPEA4]|uniref:hypothetical protein n=1 Tax=Nannocystis sp. SCPEA4 TaxID=2996787 RepID=UPI00226F0709|nr:hypothetical protein [Nannocystis sp. SCPEA4]MCY1054251.1 hypothetical protein [Nannocystis sp. SCPEA4]
MRRFTLALAAGLGVGLALGGAADASPRKVCPGVHKPCGDECYDPLTQSCLLGALVCKGAQKSCGDRCYDPHHQSCHDGGVVCAGTQKACGAQCYDPVTQDCQLQANDQAPEDLEHRPVRRPGLRHRPA